MKSRGFIAITSVIILCATLLTAVAAGSLSGFFSRSVGLDAEYKMHSEALANACIQTILERLHIDATYAGGEIVSIDADSCRILPGASGDPRTFSVQAIYDHAYTNRVISVDIATLWVVSNIEVATF